MSRKKERPLVSIIVPTLNESKHILATLQALHNQTFPREKYEIIVSDSSSDDDTVKKARKYSDTLVVCRRQSAGYGRNVGARKARAALFGFVDSDTVVSPTWVEGLYETLSRKGVVACTGAIEPLEKDSANIILFYKLWDAQLHFSLFIGKPIIPGANFGVHRDAFFAEGGFPEGNQLYEDMDLSFRLVKRGRVMYSSKMGVATSSRRQHEIPLHLCVYHGLKYMFFRKSMTWNEFRSDFGKHPK